MNILRLRDGYLLINAEQIASVEKVGTSVHVYLTSGQGYALADADATAVLAALAPAPIVNTNVEVSGPAASQLVAAAVTRKGKK